MEKFSFRRMTAWLLALVMIISLIPANALPVFAAEEEPVVVIAGSDYQNTNGGLFSSGASTTAYAIMSQIKEDYSSAYGFLFGGDYYAHSTNTTTESTNGKNQLKNEIVDALYPDMADDTQIYIQGNHDADSLTTNGTLATSGAHDTDYYGVYVINEKDYMWYNDNQTTIKNTASALASYLDAKVDAGYSKPIFVLSHLPLHYSNRTIKEGDGKYAKYIYDVLDEAGANDLNIIFLYGHNHSTSYYEEYLGNGAVYLAKGDTIYVANEGSQSSCFSDSLNFTYMNYGFTGYLTGTAADGALTMTVFEITSSQVLVKRYDTAGVHNLKSAGTNGSTPSGAVYNTKVYTSPQTIKLTTPVERTTLTSNGVTLTAAGITSFTATKAEDPIYNASLHSAFEKYDLSAEGFTSDGTVTITLTEDDFDTSRPIIVMHPSGASAAVEVVNGTITFKTDVMGTYTLAQLNQTEIQIPGESEPTGDGTIWRLASSMTAGKNYMLVVYGDNASGISNFAVNSTAGGTAVTVLNDGTAYIENSDMALAWTYNSNAELINASTGQYLYIANYPTSTATAEIAVTGSVTTGTSYSSWNLKSNSLASDSDALSGTSLAVYRNGSSNYYPVRWSNGDQSFLSYVSDQTSKHDNWLLVFEQTSEGGSSSGGSSVTTTGGEWITITQPTGGTTTYTYTLATSITAGGKYVIVANNQAVALHGTTSMGTQSVTISGTTMTSTTELTEWTISGTGSATVYNGSRYLRYNNGMGLNDNESSVYVVDNGNNFIIKRRERDTGYALYYNNGSWTTSNQNTVQYVRLYQLTDTTTTGGTNGEYAKISGELTYTVPYGTSETVALNKVMAGITGYTNTTNSGTGNTLDDDDLVWTVVGYDSETPGEYAVNISYNGKLLGTAKIVVNAKPAGTAQVTINSDSGTVRQNAGAAALTSNKLTITYQNGTTETVNVTVGMLRDQNGNAVSTATAGKIENLKVVYTYGGVEYTILDNYTLNVRENVQNNYPEYPDEGAVKVNKTATGIDFQSSGIAQIELSVSGVPSKKGVDVIVMVDTSSSMKRGAGTNDEVSAPNRRIDFLQVALANLIREFQAVGDDGEQLDINVAIAEFNGYKFISENDEPSDSNQQGATNVAEVFTGDGSTGAGAFVQATTIANPDAFAANIGEHSGTNYDYAFDTIYRLGSAIKAQNEANNEDRDLFVIFMSDGAPYGYNYYGSGTTDTWDDYLNGHMTLNANGRIVDDTGVYLKGNTHFYRTDGKHWMAEAIKGSTDETYMVIDPTDSLGADATAADVKVYEDAGIILTEGETSYFRMVSGLGAEIHTIGFCLYDDDQGSGNIVYATTQKELMQRLASTDSQGNLCYHETESGSDLNDIFCEIASQIAYAANNARFVDQMGDNFNLQMKPVTYVTVENGAEVEKSLTPKIEILTYDIYTRQNFIDGLCTEDQIGDRKGTFTIVETVTFKTDGDGNVIAAYSDQIGGGETNILADGTQEGYVKGVIYAKTFIYNTNILEVKVEGVDIPTGVNADGTTTGSTNVLPSETFYWKLGTVQTSELAMRYYVYLDGSMEGTKEKGSYATNEFAILYYDNYLGNPVYKETTSPTVAWKEASVSYAFYLVNENGEIVVNQTTGQTGSFANKIAITNPVLYETVLLNNDEQVSSLDVIAISDDVLPKYYTLYDSAAVYEVTINSNSTGSWVITKGNVAVASTYVTQYKTDNASAYSNELENSTVGDDYTHTVVWFAVVWKPQAHPDAVVVDYGLPVDISVLANDMFGENGKLVGVGPLSALAGKDYDNGLYHDTALASGFGSSYTGTYGTATADTATGKVRYTLNTSNGMQMQTYEKFAYAVHYTGSANPGYYYDTITIIPATTIYYEDNFVTTESYTWDYTNNAWKKKDTSLWTQIGTVNGVQDEDRPGKYSLTDANNIYGYDKANLAMSTYSMGNALKATVDYDNYAVAEFSFYGTGFDVISMTSVATGTLAVTVRQGDNVVKSFIVDTYYGYKQEAGDANGDGTVADGEMIWVVDPTSTDCLYQIPVIKVEDLPYNKYDVEIQALYEPIFDNVEGSASYDLYLDAIRIYDPANDGAADGTTDTTIEDAYKADGEGWPSYLELRNMILDANSFDKVANDALTTDMEGLVFIDGDASLGNAQIADYKSYGPNNEVYLAPGQRVAFIIGDNDNIASVHIGIKSADGNTATWTVTNIAQAANTETGLKAGDYYAAKTATINTTTDMYYDITGYMGDIIVISNTSDRYYVDEDGILSITNIKFTYERDPKAAATTNEETGDTGIETAAVASTYGVARYSVAAVTGVYSTMATAAATATTDDTAAVASGEGTIYMTATAATLAVEGVNAMYAEDEVVEDDTNTDVEEPAVPEIPETPEEPTEPEIPHKPQRPEEDKKPGKPEDHKKPGKGHQDKGHGKHDGKHHREYFDDCSGHDHGRRGH